MSTYYVRYDMGKRYGLVSIEISYCLEEERSTNSVASSTQSAVLHQVWVGSFPMVSCRCLVLQVS